MHASAKIAAPASDGRIPGLLDLVAAAMGDGLALLGRAEGNAVRIEDAPPSSLLPGMRFAVPEGLLGQGATILPTAGIRLPVAWTSACGSRPAFLAAAPLAHSGLYVIVASTDAAPPPERIALAAGLVDDLLSGGSGTRAAEASSGRIEALVRHLPVPLVFADSRGLEVFANDEAAALLGVDGQALRTTAIASALARLIGGEERAPLRRALASDPHAPLDFELTHGHRHYRVESDWIEDSALAGRVWLFSDITEAKQLQQRLSALASSDPLTGFLNRRSFDARLAEEIERSRRSGAPLSVLALDLDRFKSVNDTWGHPAGDTVLKTACRSAESAIRSSDILARLGGEEFAILLPNTDSAGAREVGERVRAAIEAAVADHDGLELRITSSIGAATLGEGEDATTLLTHADGALYVAKHSGRNRVVEAV